MEKSLHDIYSKIDDLFTSLEKKNEYINYKKIIKKISGNNKINNILSDIKRLQKIYVNTKDDNVLKKINNLYDELEKIPVYQSYLFYKEEVENDLIIIKNIFEKYFEHILKFN